MADSVMKKLKILLVEDEPIVMFVHKKMLTDLGYAPDIATTGNQAIDLAANEYDVIFMDIGLPDISGTEAVAEIRRREEGKKRTYIVALTGYPYNEVEDTCKMTGVDKILSKPTSMKNLQATLTAPF